MSARDRLEAWRMENRIQDATAEINTLRDPAIWQRRYHQDVRMLLSEVDRLDSIILELERRLFADVRMTP